MSDFVNARAWRDPRTQNFKAEVTIFDGTMFYGEGHSPSKAIREAKKKAKKVLRGE